MSKYVDELYRENTYQNVEVTGFIKTLDSVCLAHNLSHHLSMIHSKGTSETEGALYDSGSERAVQLVTVPLSNFKIAKK